MGQWSHRRRRGGGGPPPSPPLIEIDTANITSPLDILLTYTAPITAAAFNPADFSTNPSFSNPDTINQGDPDQLELAFPDAVDAEESITYTGATAGIRTPQTKQLQ